MSRHGEPPQVDAPASFARRLVERELVGANGHEAAVLSSLVEQVHIGLSRWFGPYGALALMTRALRRARPAHARLAGVVVSATTTPHLAGWSDAEAPAEAEVMAEATIAVLDSLHQTLTRLIGDDLAETLLAPSDVPTVPSTTEMSVSPNASDE